MLAWEGFYIFNFGLYKINFLIHLNNYSISVCIQGFIFFNFSFFPNYVVVGHKSNSTQLYCDFCEERLHSELYITSTRHIEFLRVLREKLLSDFWGLQRLLSIADRTDGITRSPRHRDCLKKWLTIQRLTWPGFFSFGIYLATQLPLSHEPLFVYMDVLSV